jgi:hypothetical protein
MILYATYILIFFSSNFVKYESLKGRYDIRVLRLLWEYIPLNLIRSQLNQINNSPLLSRILLKLEWIDKI